MMNVRPKDVLIASPGSWVLNELQIGNTDLCMINMAYRTSTVLSSRGEDHTAICARIILIHGVPLDCERLFSLVSRAIGNPGKGFIPVF